MREDERARWTKLVADFESADLSQREFAQERGLPISNLRYWIYRLRKESRPSVEALQRAKADNVAGTGERHVRYAHPSASLAESRRYTASSQLATMLLTSINDDMSHPCLPPLTGVANER